jgi:hypothetical protein
MWEFKTLKNVRIWSPLCCMEQYGDRLTANCCAINHRLFPSHMTFPVPSVEIYDGEVSSSAGAVHDMGNVLFHTRMWGWPWYFWQTGLVLCVTFHILAPWLDVVGWMVMDCESCGRGKMLHTSTFLTLTLDVGEWSALHTGHFTLLQRIHYPLNRRQGGPQSWSGHFGKEKNLLPLPGI